MGDDKSKGQQSDPFGNACTVVLGKAQGINEQLDRLLEKRRLTPVLVAPPKPSPT